MRKKIVNAGTCVRLKRWINPANLTTIVGGNNAWGTPGVHGTMGFTLAGCGNIATFTAMYNQFKIEKVTVYFTLLAPDPRPGYTTDPSVPAQEAARFWPVLYTAVDKSSNTTDSNLVNFLDRNPRRRPMAPGRTYAVSFVPVNPLGDGGHGGWYRMDNDQSTVFCSLKYWLDFMGEDEQRVDVKAVLTCCFRGLR